MTRAFYCRDLRDGYRIAKRKITWEKIALCEICSRCPSYVVPVTIPGQRQAGGSVIHQGTGPGGRRPGRPAARAALAGLAGIVVLAAAGVAGAALTRHGLHDVAAAADAGSDPHGPSRTRAPAPGLYGSPGTYRERCSRPAR